MDNGQDIAAAIEKRARDLSKVVVQFLGGGSEWFSRIGDEYYADPEIVGAEMQRRKTDAIVTKKALVRSNRAHAGLIAALNEAFDFLGGVDGASEIRATILAALANAKGEANG